MTELDSSNFSTIHGNDWTGNRTTLVSILPKVVSVFIQRIYKKKRNFICSSSRHGDFISRMILVSYLFSQKLCVFKVLWGNILSLIGFTIGKGANPTLRLHL